MTMFNRNDKPNETTPATATVPPPGTPTPAATAAPEVKRPQAVAQPISSSTSTGGVSVISKALKITGQLESTEDIRIDGEVNGDVRAVSVTVGNNAKVKGNVYGDTVELAGTVEGKIEAKKVVLNSTARMTGDVDRIRTSAHPDPAPSIDGHLKPEFGKDTKSKSTNGAGHA